MTQAQVANYEQVGNARLSWQAKEEVARVKHAATQQLQTEQQQIAEAEQARNRVTMQAAKE